MSRSCTNRYSWLSKVPSSQLWRLFSPALFRGICASDTKSVHQFIQGLLQAAEYREAVRVADVYEQAFSYLSKHQPTEYFYKNALLQWQVFSESGSKRSRLIFEFRSGRSKLDALVINGGLHAFEIKTERDQFTRLAAQINDYRSRFPLVSVLTSEKQASRLEHELDPSIGIGFLTSRQSFRFVREAECRQSELRSELMLEGLRRAEYVGVLKQFGFVDHGIPNTLLFREGMRFAQSLDPEQVLSAVTERLRARGYSFSAASLARLPRAVRAAAVAAKCRDANINVALQNLDEQVCLGGGE